MNRRTVLFDLYCAQPVQGSKYHGGGEYTKTILKELCEKWLDRIDLIVFYNSQLFIDEWIINTINEYSIKVIEISSYEELSESNIFGIVDVLFVGLMTGLSRLNIPSNTRVIGVFHGHRTIEAPIDCTALLYTDSLKEKTKCLIKILFKNLYFKYKYKEVQEKINKCSELVGVSTHSFYSHVVFFPNYDTKKVHVFYSPFKYVEEYTRKTMEKDKKIILMIGGNRWVKNTYRGIKAIDQLFSANMLRDYHVRVVGGIPKGIKKRIKNIDSFLGLDSLDAKDLENEYYNCDLFFYPSLNEGFGYPPLEAMKYGKTCLVSAVSSLPGIYENSVYYCNPYDIHEMKSRLLEAIDRPIYEGVVENHYKRITQRQLDDLTRLCKLIAE